MAPAAEVAEVVMVAAEVVAMVVISAALAVKLIRSKNFMIRYVLQDSRTISDDR